jgi:hypothetical protein
MIDDLGNTTGKTKPIYFQKSDMMTGKNVQVPQVFLPDRNV